MSNGITLYFISGETSVRKRHKMIKEFQEKDERPKIMIMMVRTGACGVTLTAATRIYLMEPCFNPSTEIQIAGRIHRLGQSKDVLCKKFCFKDCVESCIISVHNKLKAGTLKITNTAYNQDVLKLLAEK